MVHPFIHFGCVPPTERVVICATDGTRWESGVVQNGLPEFRREKNGHRVYGADCTTELLQIVQTKHHWHVELRHGARLTVDLDKRWAVLAFGRETDSRPDDRDLAGCYIVLSSTTTRGLLVSGETPRLLEDW